MTTPEDQPRILRRAMRLWRQRTDALAHERDGLVLAALDAGIIKEEIHQTMGLGRTTIDRIAKEAQS